MQSLAGIGGERYWVHVPRSATKVRAYRNGGLVAAAHAVRSSPMANAAGDSELIHVNKYELQQLREMWGDPVINPETGLPAYGLFGSIWKGIKSIAKPVAKIAGTVLLTPVLGPVGAAAAVSAVSGAIEGKSIGQIVKGAGLSALTAGAGQLGGKLLPGALGVSKSVGTAIGAGLGTAAGVAAQGGNLSQSLQAGISGGLGTYATNKMFDTVVNKNIAGLGDAARAIYGAGQDISKATGINLGASTNWLSSLAPKTPSPYQQMLQTKAPASVVESYSQGVTNNLVPVTPSAPVISGAGDAAAPIIVTGSKPAVVASGTELYAGTPDLSGIKTIPTPSGSNVAANNVTVYPDAVYMPSQGGAGELQPSGGTYYMGPRSDIYGERGLANITFDPFTYGQTGSKQPGEFLFFTQGGKPYGAVASQSAPAAKMKDGGDVEDDEGEDQDDVVKHLVEWNKGEGHTGPGRVKGIGSGQEDKIPAWLSDGEYVWSAQDVADLGDGSTDEGVRRLDKMRQMVRRRAGRKDVKKIAKPQHGIDTMLKAVGGPV